MPAKSEALLPLLRRLNALVPEGEAKNRIRALLLSLRSGLPRELMAGRGETVVQVGMWRRRNLARLSRCVGPAGRVLLVEADTRVVEDLTGLLEANRLTNVTIVNRGAFNRPGRQRFQVGKAPIFSRLEETDAHMLSEVGREAFEAVEEIEVDTLDHILAENGISRVDYLEISVNGLELEVLEGMERMLPSTRRLFLSGYARVSGTGEPTNARTVGLLRERGFRTKISRRSPPRQDYFDDRAAAEWGLMEGHVFAWRP